MQAVVDLRSMEAAHPQGASGRDAGGWQGSWGELFYSQDNLGSNGSGRPSSSEPGLASSAGSDADSSSAGPTASPLTGFGLAGMAGPTPNSSAAAPAARGKLSARYIRDEQENKKWPVLREGDGGRHVHALHAALEKKGYWPGDDDMRWWQYGDATVSAMQSAQVSSAHEYRMGLLQAATCVTGAGLLLASPDLGAGICKLLPGRMPACCVCSISCMSA